MMRWFLLAFVFGAGFSLALLIFRDGGSSSDHRAPIWQSSKEVKSREQNLAEAQRELVASKALDESSAPGWQVQVTAASLGVMEAAHPKRQLIPARRLFSSNSAEADKDSSEDSLTTPNPSNAIGLSPEPLEVTLPIVQPGEAFTIPAALANPSADNVSSGPTESGVENLAEEFVRRLKARGLSPDSPEYLRAWEEEAWRSDLQFKARYGQQVWMQRHIQAFHQNQVESAANSQP